MFNIKKLFTDFDNTLVSTTEAFIKTYSSIHKDHPEFIQPNWEDVNEWDFKDTCHLLNGRDDVEAIFKMKELFDNLKLINHNTYEVLEKISNKYQIVLVSIGSYENIHHKSLYVKNNIPFIKDSVFLVNENCAMKKELVNMSGEGNVFLEDVKSNLDSVIVDRKICFGRIRSWNEQWEGERAFNWSEVAEKLL